MWFVRISPRARWRFAALPLTVWLILTLVALGGAAALERANHDGLVLQFHHRVGLAANFVTGLVHDLIERQHQQAVTFLSAPVVAERDFARLVDGSGVPAAVLLDAHGRVLRVAPTGALPRRGSDRAVSASGRRAVRQGRPAVSSVVTSLADPLPVVNVAVPFDTTAGRRVFAG
jgi:hypothetical protein